MKIETILYVVSLLGIGGILGSFLQYLWNKKSQIFLQNQNYKEERYHNILGFMRCFCEPSAIMHHEITDNQGKKIDPSKFTQEEIEHFIIERLVGSYYHIILYAPDNVLNKIKAFIEDPNKANWIETALEMRKDLWAKTKIDASKLALNESK